MGAMTAPQSRLPLRGERKTLLERIREHNAANLILAHDVLTDTGNPQFAHLLDWARRVIGRLEGRAA